MRTYKSLVAVYRPGTRGNFDRVSDTITITKQNPSANILVANTLLLGFNCDYYELDEAINVTMGDVIGACVYDTGDTGQLDLVSSTDNGDFLPVDSVNHADCDTGTVPRRLMNDHLEATNTRILLHLFAEIGKFSCVHACIAKAVCICKYGDLYPNNCWHLHSSR